MLPHLSKFSERCPGLVIVCVIVIFKYWAGDITQVAECLLSTQDPGFNLQACVSWMWQFIPIILAPWRQKQAGPLVKGHHWLHRELEANLASMRSCLNKQAYNQTALVDKQPLSLRPSFLKPNRVPSDPCDSCDSLLFPEPLAPPCKLQSRGLQPVMGWGSRAGASTLFE